MIQQRSAVWLNANTAPIICNDDSLASRFAKRHGRKTTKVIVTDVVSRGVAA
jgi:hypothetical protein